MFDIGWSELLVIAVVALIAIGPKELPGVLRMVGQWMGKIRRMASDFQGQFQEAMREAEVEGLKKEFDDITNTASSVTSFDPGISAASAFPAFTCVIWSRFPATTSVGTFSVRSASIEGR